MARYPLAIWTPGPAEKQGYAGSYTNAVKGVIMHSMVGWFTGAMSRLNGPDRASWHFSVLQDGTVRQHYDTTAVCWHGGAKQVNEKYVGLEHEGGYNPVNEPLTPAQLESSKRLVDWLSKTHGFVPSGWTILPHNAVHPTACPSGRVPIETEYYMDIETRNAVMSILAQLGKLGADIEQLRGELQATFGQLLRIQGRVDTLENR